MNEGVPKVETPDSRRNQVLEGLKSVVPAGWRIDSDGTEWSLVGGGMSDEVAEDSLYQVSMVVAFMEDGEPEDIEDARKTFTSKRDQGIITPAMADVLEKIYPELSADTETA